jgi:CRISPR system Cascade subunit CasA
VSLREAFLQGEDLLDLAVRPHERIALMRLLICVAQAALDGPSDLDDWETCKSRVAPAANEYLGRWEGAFDLLDGERRFLQVADLKRTEASKGGTSKKGSEPEGTPTSKLDFALATGNNATLFDHAGGSARTFPTGQLALMLLTYQCFSPGGTIGIASWNGSPTAGNGSSDHAPCIAGGMLHAFVRGRHLLDSVYLNLMSKEQAAKFLGKDSWGKPVWELMPEGPAHPPAIRNATRTYLGRLVPLARAIRLVDGGTSLILANGLRYASFPEWREPSSTVVVRESKGQPDRALLRADIDKATWRELHALSLKVLGQDTIGGPAALQNLPDEAPFDLWVGGIVASKAKLIDTVESSFHVPAAMRGELGQSIYEEGVREAERTASRIKRAVSTYHRELGNDLDRPETKERRQKVQSKACTRYWTDIEGDVPRLLEVVSAPGLLGLERRWRGTPWGRAIRRAAFAAYEDACPHETPRQIRAWATGLSALVGPVGATSGEDEGPEA